jgi:hypothetical protein
LADRNQREFILNVYQKLNEARERFHKLKLEKTGHNKFAGYKYFELGDFLIPALGVFKELGLCATVSFEKEIAVIQIVNVDKPEEQIILSSPMGSAQLKGCHEIQNIGACETYQRRYLWVAALEIVEHDALDSSEPVKGAEVVKAAKTGVVADVLKDLPALDAESSVYYKELAANAQDLFDSKGIKVAYDRIESEGLEQEQRLYLWAELGSKIRSALKAESGLRRGAA